MAEHIWSILSSKAVIDSQTNQLSLFDVLEQINLSGTGPQKYQKGTEALIPLNPSLTTFWVRSDLEKPEKVKTRLRIIAPDKQCLYTREDEVDLTAHRRHRAIATFQGFRLRGPGVYKYLIDMGKKGEKGKNWKNVATIPFEVIFDLQSNKP